MKSKEKLTMTQKAENFFINSTSLCQDFFIPYRVEKNMVNSSYLAAGFMVREYLLKRRAELEPSLTSEIERVRISAIHRVHEIDLTLEEVA